MSQAALSDSGPPAQARPRWLVVSSLGVAQVLAWGSSYYLPAVLAGPIARDTGWPLGWVIGALSIGLLVSGLVSPRVGHVIERHGGRPVLAASAILLALGQLGMALAPNLAAFVLAWVVVGLGMGAGLYDPAFSALGRLYGEQARPAITHLTLFGGFASTVCWPLTAFFNAHLGWRGACLSYAAVMLAAVLPLYLFGLPREEERRPRGPSGSGARPGHVRPEQRGAFILLASGFTLAYATMTVVGVHLLMLLQDQGLSLTAAVALGALVGPAQVGGRILEMAFGRKAHPIWSLLASSVLVAVGLALLVAAPGITAAAIVLYGMGSGIRSIARGTVPLAIFGREGYAILMGRLALPTLLATAAAPLIGTALLNGVGPTGTLAFLCLAAIVQLALVVPLVPIALRSRAQRHI